MSDAQDDLIRQRAHAIWEAEGCPDGRQEQHWAQATAEVAQAQDEAAALDQPTLATLANDTGPEAVPATAAQAMSPAAEDSSSGTEAKPARRPRKASETGSASRGRRKKGD